MESVIVFRRFKDLAICGNVNIPYGTELGTIVENGQQFVAFPDGKKITKVHSQNYNQHFALNDDERGLVRGKLTYAIAFSPRERKHENGHVSRLSEDEIDMIRKDWSKYLMPYDDTILFNDAFYDAPIEDLQKLADALEIQIKE
jgi:hypothetical protein